MKQHAQQLFCTLQQVFTSPHLTASFRALMALFLKGNGCPYPHHASSKSPAALSRFLNHYSWNSRSLIWQARQEAMKSLFGYYQSRRGGRPRLLVMIDLSTLEKAGRFQQLGLVRMLNKKRGVHMVVMYLVAGPLRIPWSFRLWRGKGETSSSALALKLLRQLPKPLIERFSVLVLADGSFGNGTFLGGVKRLNLDAVVGIRSDRCLEGGRQLMDVLSGEQVTPTGLSFAVTLARHHLKRQGKQETRVVVATFAAKGHIISRWGKRRWSIEAFFKTAKSHFGLACFGQQTLLGVLRFLLLSLLAFTLSQWQTWMMPKAEWPDWRELAMSLRHLLLPELVQAELQAELERLRPYLAAVEGSGI